MFVRQWAYLGATRKGAKVSRMEELRNPLGKSDPLDYDEQEAAQALLEVHLPKIYPAYDYLRGLFFDSGQATSTGMGLVALSWQELSAFRKENDLNLTVWERQTLKKMSEAYCSEYAKASDANHPAPYAIEKDEETGVNEEQELAKAMSWMSVLRSSAKRT